MLDRQISLAYVTFGWRIFADKNRMSYEEVSDSSSCNDYFLSSGKVLRKDHFFCTFFDIFKFVSDEMETQ